MLFFFFHWLEHTKIDGNFPFVCSLPSRGSKVEEGVKEEQLGGVTTLQLCEEHHRFSCKGEKDFFFFFFTKDNTSYAMLCRLKGEKRRK